jgi:UDP-glucose 4-epimerase
MKCLVTGGAGFIGSHIVDELISKGHDVVVIDNESSKSNAIFYYNPKAVYYKLDIVDYSLTRELYVGVDYVFHLAAESRIQPTLINPSLAFQTNTLGTQIVLQCSLEAKVKRVIYSSTSAAYGLINSIPLSEEMPNDCLNPYSVSKVAGEEICILYNRLYNLPTTILRYFNVYGDRQPILGQYAPVIGLFIEQ